MTREEATAIIKERYEFWQKHYAEECKDYGEALEIALEALQEQERIIKQLEELRDDPIMYCSEDYWEGHYMAVKEAIAIVRGVEE